MLTMVPIKSHACCASMHPHCQPLPPLKKCKLVTHLRDCCSPHCTSTSRLHMPLSSATRGWTMTMTRPLPNNNNDSTRMISENQWQWRQRGPHQTTTMMTTQQGQSARTGKEEEAPTRQWQCGKDRQWQWWGWGLHRTKDPWMTMKRPPLDNNGNEASAGQMACRWWWWQRWCGDGMTRPPHQIMTRMRPPQDKWLMDDNDNSDVGRSDNKAPSVNEDVASAGQMACGQRRHPSSPWGGHTLLVLLSVVVSSLTRS